MKACISILLLWYAWALALAAQDVVPKQGLLLWLDVSHTEVKGGVVRRLFDVSGNGRDAVRDGDPQQALANPTIVQDGQNRPPVLRFDGRYSSFTFPELTNIQTVFWVVRKDREAFEQKQELFVLGHDKRLDFHPGTHFTDTILHKTPQYGSPALQNGRAWMNGREIDPRATDFPQELSVITLESTATVAADQLGKDRQFRDRCRHGDIAEVLLYDRVLSNVERSAIEAGLMKKYSIAPGIPLNMRPERPWAFFKGIEGAGHGHRILFITGDDEYKSEETMPMMAQILAQRHGFDCTVLFPINKATGVIDTNPRDYIPGLEKLGAADLMVIFTRFRALPDEQMKFIDDYLKSGKPVIGIRTATHAFSYPSDSSSKYRRYSFNYNRSDFVGGFGRQVLGQTWINHWGQHGHQNTRAIFVPGVAPHPILRGIADGEIWGPTDVYEATLPLPDGCQPLLLGAVLQGMKPEDPLVAGEQFNGKWKKMVMVNDPMMPVAWTWERGQGARGRVFTTTMGGAMAGGSDFENEAMRRLLVNACYWTLCLEDKLPARADVTPVDKPMLFKRGIKPWEASR